ncbi:hypothetical protein [Virgibacillus necropolis]|uniref:Lipoprotein n=1 Tax=Virgibacillus necropolis TaxID=163877 RepID=A0A221MCQ2_9BACI|nr:hypothetical protein [Virgibacillus necropolis]ASN05407.1 hypothetical protein CFK40_10485 [Virgibacillus necropolis]
MIKKTLFLSLILLLLLMACKTKTIIFSGESKNWSAKLKITQTDDMQEEEFQLRYKGEDVNSVGEFDYEIDSVGSSSRTNAILNEDGSLMDNGSMCSGCAFTTEETEVVVTVEWNDKKEIFTLVNE